MHFSFGSSIGNWLGLFKTKSSLQGHMTRLYARGKLIWFVEESVIKKEKWPT